MSSPNLLTTGFREKSLPNGQILMWAANKWCWNWPQLFILLALAMTQPKLILERQSYKKKQENKKKQVLKKYEIV